MQPAHVVSHLGPAGWLVSGLLHPVRGASFYAQYRIAARVPPMAKREMTPSGMPSTGDVLERLFSSDATRLPSNLPGRRIPTPS